MYSHSPPALKLLAYAAVSHALTDTCWEKATHMIMAGTLADIEGEAFAWQRNLSSALEHYYNEEQAAYLALQHGQKQQVRQLWQRDFHPRPQGTRPTETDVEMWRNRNHRRFFGTLAHPLRVPLDITKDRDLLSTRSEAYTRRRWDFFLPSGIVAKMEATACRKPVPLGGSRYDDHKVVCDLGGLRARKCIVYSLGSDGEWDFEDAVLSRHPQCTVHTFDCTSGPPRKRGGNKVEASAYRHYRVGSLVFHKLCVGSAAPATQMGPFERLGDLVIRLGHPHITLLKVDVEGFEVCCLTLLGHLQL